MFSLYKNTQNFFNLLRYSPKNTCLSYEKLVNEFDPDVADGILALSKNGGIESNQEKMVDSLMRIKQQQKETWMVKLADRKKNLQPLSGLWKVEK